MSGYYKLAHIIGSKVLLMGCSSFFRLEAALRTPIFLITVFVPAKLYAHAFCCSLSQPNADTS